jgi:hypothetical protein
VVILHSEIIFSPAFLNQLQSLPFHMSYSINLRRALLSIFLASSVGLSSAAVVYNETFGNTDVSDPNQSFSTTKSLFTATNVTYAEYSTYPSLTSLYLQRSTRTNQGAGYTPNIAPDANLAIARPGGGMTVSGISTSAFTGQNLTLSVSVLLGYAPDASGASSGLYPFAEGSSTIRTMTANLNDYVKFEVSYDLGANWSTVTLSKTIDTVDASRPWTQWSVDLGSIVSSEFQFRFQDTGLLTGTDALDPNDSNRYQSPIRLDSLMLNASAAVPEPATYALGAGSMVLLITFLRRKIRPSEATASSKKEMVA